MTRFYVRLMAFWFICIFAFFLGPFTACMDFRGRSEVPSQVDGSSSQDVLLPDENSHVQDHRVQDTLVRDTPAQDTQSQDTQSQDMHIRDVGVQDTHVQDTHVQDVGVPDTHIQDVGIPDTHVQDTHIQDTAPVAVQCGQFDDPRELISDRHFHRGFIYLDQKTKKPSTTMLTGLCKEKPIWSIAQWGSLGDLSKAPRKTLATGAVRWSNAYGRVTVGRRSDADLTFGVWAYKEYGGKYHIPTTSRVWVHLLAEQRISPPDVPQAGCPPLSSLSRLDFKMNARLLKDDPHHQAGYSTKKHAAQFLIYFTVQNLNKNSKGFGDYLWFGLTPYDDRYTLPKTSIRGDRTGAIGTGKLIYNMGAAPFLKIGMKVGAPEQTFAKNILPDIRKALLEAWRLGYLPGSKDLSDYRIGGMNIGWEVPGLNDVEMKVRNLSLRYAKKSTAPIVFDFNKKGDREGWTAVNLTDFNNGPSQGKWVLQAPGKDPYILSPKLSLDAAAHKTLHIVFANDHNPAAASNLRVYWERFGESGFREAWSVVVPVKNNGGWYKLAINLSTNPAWKGEITRLRIDPVVSGDGHSVGFDRISF